jgi:hypothetical protein
VPLYGRNLVSDDFHGAAINVFFREMSDADYAALGVDQKIRVLLDANRGPEAFYIHRRRAREACGRRADAPRPVPLSRRSRWG